MDRPTAHLFYDFGEFRADVRQRLLLLRDSGRTLPLSSRAFDTLIYFLENPGRLLDKSTLMAAVWPNTVVEENNLNQHISTLRRVLGETRDDHRFIVTEPGRGYRFVADVRASLSQPEPEPTPPSVPDSAPPSPPGRHFQVSVLIVLAVAVIGGAALLWFRLHDAGRAAAQIVVTAAAMPDAPAVPARAPGRQLRLAILPFQNLSPDPDNAFFADGLHEEVLSTIGQRLPAVQVISRTTMTSDRLKAQSIATVASELGATHVIEGSVRREGNKVRLTLQLIDAGTDQQIWSQTYDRTLTSALTLEAEVANEVALRLSVRLTEAEQGASPHTTDPEAYDLYLKAVLALRALLSNSSAGDFRNVEELLTRAIARDPRFALAYVQRARAATLYYIGGQDTSAQGLQRIRVDITTARSLAPHDPMAIAVEGFLEFAQGENQRALATFDVAQAAGLNEPEFLLPKTRLLLRLSRVDEAMRLHEHLLELDPANPLLIEFAVQHMWIVRRPAEALHIAGLAAGQDADLGEALRAQTLLSFTGTTVPMRRLQNRFDAAQDPKLIAAIPIAVREKFRLLRFEHRYAQLQQFLQLVPPTPVPYNQLLDTFEIYDIGEIGTVPGGVQYQGCNVRC